MAEFHRSGLFPRISQDGFVVYSKQRIYRFALPYTFESGVNGHWQTWTSNDIPAVRLLSDVGPPLIQPIEPLTRLESLGWFAMTNKESCRHCRPGIWAGGGLGAAFVHPQSPWILPAYCFSWF